MVAAAAVPALRGGALTTLRLRGSYPLVCAVLSSGAAMPATTTVDKARDNLMRLDRTIFKVSNGLANVGEFHLACVDVPASGSFNRGTLVFNYNAAAACGTNEQVAWGDAVAASLSQDERLKAVPRRMMMLPRRNTCGWAGMANVGATPRSHIYVRDTGDIDIITHEFGHSLGFMHSSSGSNEYGDSACVMGVDFNSKKVTDSINPAQTYLAGWLPDAQLIEAPALVAAGGPGVKATIKDANTHALVLVRPLVAVYGCNYTPVLPLPLLVIALRKGVLTVHAVLANDVSRLGYVRTDFLYSRKVVDGLTACINIPPPNAKMQGPVVNLDMTQPSPEVVAFLGSALSGPRPEAARQVPAAVQIRVVSLARGEVVLTAFPAAKRSLADGGEAMPSSEEKEGESEIAQEEEQRTARGPKEDVLTFEDPEWQLPNCE
jgi:hypothetical protein